MAALDWTLRCFSSEPGNVLNHLRYRDTVDQGGYGLVVPKILEYRPDLIQVLDLQKVEKNLKLATELLKGIHHLLSSLKKGHDGLEEKLKRALWLREWLEPRKKL